MTAEAAPPRILSLKHRDARDRWGIRITSYNVCYTKLLRVCDNYIIGPDGPGECLHQTPKEIIIIS